MRAKFTQAFKAQAVEKALSRSETTTLREVADSLGIGHSTLNRWMIHFRQHTLEPATEVDASGLSFMQKEKRPQDWSPENRLNLIIACDPLDDEAVNARCREQGVYPHHLKQWRQGFVGGTADNRANVSSKANPLKRENKRLQKELNRKDKALAETAALLVLQKKVHAIWGHEEDDSQ